MFYCPSWGTGVLKKGVIVTIITISYNKRRGENENSLIFGDYVNKDLDKRVSVH